MATEVNFYHLTRSSLEDALPRLLQKTLQAGERAVVLGRVLEVEGEVRVVRMPADEDQVVLLPLGNGEVTAPVHVPA